VTFLTGKGYANIILIGHSTGANKVCYFVSKTGAIGVSGIVLSSPISDRLIALKTHPDLDANVKRMKRMIEKGKGEFLLNNLLYFPITPRRYVALFSEDSPENVFSYGSFRGGMELYSGIKAPMLVILAENDEYADRSVAKIREAFDRHTGSERYESVMIPHAVHGFDGHEHTFARTVVDWMKSIMKG
jgi:alpha-beta hydrolase superfamily lysophospholipase